MRTPSQFGAGRSLSLILLVLGGVGLIPLAVVWQLHSRTGLAPMLVGLAAATLGSLLISRLVVAWWPGEWWPDDLRRKRGHLLGRVAATMEAEDLHMAGHSRRVARHVWRLGRGMGLAGEDLRRVREAATLHDVGKLGIPQEILLKPGPLTAQEFDLTKRHSEAGALIVSSLGDPELTAMVMHHHERIDGTGYPSRLRGQEIPLGARIVAVADSFDAVTSARTYRDPVRHRDAFRELERCAGTQLDTDVVRAFVRCYSGWRQVFLVASPMSPLHRILFRVRLLLGARRIAHSTAGRMAHRRHAPRHWGGQSRRSGVSRHPGRHSISPGT